VTDRQRDWTIVIHSRGGWLGLDLKELWRYHNLILLPVRRDFATVYKSTLSGPTWFLIQPLFSALEFTVVFGKIANVPADGLPRRTLV